MGRGVVLFFSLVESYSSGMVAVFCDLIWCVIPKTFECALYRCISRVNQ